MTAESPFVSDVPVGQALTAWREARVAEPATGLDAGTEVEVVVYR